MDRLVAGTKLILLEFTAVLVSWESMHVPLIFKESRRDGLFSMQ